MADWLLACGVIMATLAAPTYAQKSAMSVGASRPCPLFGFGNEWLFQSVNDSGLNHALQVRYRLV